MRNFKESFDMKKMESMLKVLVGVSLIVVASFGTSCAQERKSGEEDGTELKKNQTHDVVKYGVRLVLKYDESKAAFVGTVENKSETVAERTRVEVHLSNGVELGPTTPRNLEPGEKYDVTISAKGEEFSRWSTHAEVGNREHSSEGVDSGEGHEGDGEEGGDGRSSEIIPIAKGFKGIIDGFEVDMSFSAKTMSIAGTIKNVSKEKRCYVQTEHHLKLGERTVGELKTTMLGDLEPGEKKKTSSSIREKDKNRLTKGTFNGYVIHIELSDCGGSGPKSHEGGEEHGGKEG